MCLLTLERRCVKRSQTLSGLTKHNDDDVLNNEFIVRGKDADLELV